MKEYKEALKAHVKELKDANWEMPNDGVITITYTIEGGLLIATYDSGISTKDSGNSGNPIP